jgi:hypothetical protein
MIFLPSSIGICPIHLDAATPKLALALTRHHRAASEPDSLKLRPVASDTAASPGSI